MRRNFGQARGYTIIEVMVALLILSLGLLGIAGLHLVSLRNAHGSGMRDVATQLAYDMADRMRANLDGVKAGTYDFGSSPPAVVDCFQDTATCSANQIAALDLNAWDERIKGRLGASAAGVVCRDSTPNPNDGSSAAAPGCDATPSTSTAPYVIKIYWQERDPKGAMVSSQFVTSFQP
jgi:type IV pilus assembly protein PilV